MKFLYLLTKSIVSSAAFIVLATFLCIPANASRPEAGLPAWETAVNNSVHMPGSGGKTFNSYNQPSINGYGLVVLRGRSRGGHGSGGGHDGSGEEGSHQEAIAAEAPGGEGGHGGSGGGHGGENGPAHGIYVVDMGSPGRPVTRILDRTTAVPEPNNLGTTFTETPSFPRIAMWTDTVAVRGNHQPLWEYSLEGELTRTGTTGIYTNPYGELIAGATKLGDVEEFSFFEVPEAPGTRFEVFPGAPSVTDAGIIAFKGNYLVPDPMNPEMEAGKTGVYYRHLKASPGGGNGAIQLVANSDTSIPNRGSCPAGTTFGSTAPPSAAGNHMVFVGFDNEEDPTCGGIYQAPLSLPPGQLRNLVSLDTEVPEQGGATFNRLGEGVSYSGRFAAFWGAWGTETTTLRLYCPEEGNRVRLDFCNNAGQFAPDQGDPNSICEDDGPCYQEKEIPVNQGIFVYDTAGRGKLWMVARAGFDAPYDDFVFWNYSGAPPGAGAAEADGEPPRWRSSAFVAVSQRAGATFRAAFLARQGPITPDTLLYDSPVDGIYLAESLGASRLRVRSLIRTGLAGTLLDSQALETETGTPLPVTSLGLERDSLRGRWLAITAGMGNGEIGWGGIYVTRLPAPRGR